MTQNIKKTFKSVEGLIFENHENARNWGETHFRDWSENDLTESERQTFKKYCKFDADSIHEFTIIKDYLNKFEGNLIDRHHPQYEQFKEENDVSIEELNRVIQKFDSALEKAKMPDTITIYKWIQEDTSPPINADFLGLENSDDEGTVNVSKINALKQKYEGKEWKGNDYTIGSIIKTPQNSRNIPVLFKYLIAKGTHGAYIGHWSSRNSLKPRVIVSRYQKFEVSKIKIIQGHGQEVVQIEMKASH